ncbi:MAG: SDR family NAD(P)-dependent oxidoreductase [Candidatus Binatia bacterium]
MPGSLAGKSAIVTGATRGIGKAIARACAAEGATVLVVGRGEEAGRHTVADIQSAGGLASFFKADVSDWHAVQAMAAAAVDRYGRIDILCCNAAIFPVSSIDEMEVEEWSRVSDVNLTAAFLTVKACLPRMKRQRYGRVVLTSSITGPITGVSGLTHYGATKAGMLGFMRSAAVELAPHNIAVNAVLPGTIKTELLAELPDYCRQIERAVPMGRLGTPREAADAVLFLASDRAAYITGQTLVVDGGQVLVENRLAEG